MKKRFRTCSITALTLALTFATAASLSTDADTLRLRLKVGDSLRFKSVTTTATDMMGQSMESVVTSVSVMRALEQSEGWTKVRVTTEELEMEGEGFPGAAEAIEGMKDVAYTFEVDETGLTRRIELESADALEPMVRQMVSSSMRAQNAVGFMGVHFPKGPIDVGSSWDVEIEAEKMFASEMFSDVVGEVDVSFEVVGFEDIDGRRNVKIKSEMDGNIIMAIASPAGDIEADMILEAESTYWIDVQDGTVTKMVSEGSVETEFGLGSMLQSISSTLTRVK